jgi:glycosyltransferase involved in cell wall biosynthesis
LFTETAYDLALALESADVLLPNARGEAAAIARELGVTTPAVVVPNAVDPSIFVASPVEFAERRGVICVGRIEPHKNQLGLIRALNGTALPLTIVGPPHPHHHDYLARCRREAGDAVTFIEETDEAGLPELLQRHRVHALPSLFETTGLASLEAALCGCSIVSTDRGWASEYLEDDAGYCSPWSQGSIREQIEHRYDRPPSNGFAERLGRSFNWTVTAERTLDAYELAMSSRGRANEN